MAGPVIYFLFTTALLVGLTNAQCSIEKAKPTFKRSLYEFSTSITKRIAEDTDYHFVSSPLSLWTLLSAISEGADQETLYELQHALHHHGHKCFNRKYYEMAKRVTSTDPETNLERSGLLLIDESLKVKTPYISAIEKLGISKVMSLSFKNFNKVANTVNEYVNTVTHGAISDIITNPEDIASKYVMLLDAISFKGKWKSPFSSVETEFSTFYNEFGTPNGDVNLMYQLGEFNLARIKQINATVLELPYGSSNRFSMLLFLPASGEPLANVVENLKMITLRSIFNIFEETVPGQVMVNIPRFKISSILDNMKELLNDMGITKTFDEYEAKFPYITEYSMFVSDLIQKADIEVTEEGTMASAVSAAEFTSRMLPASFTANRPFLFLIVDKHNDVILFTGAYSKATLF